MQKNHLKIPVCYVVGSGNAPTVTLCTVGLLRHTGLLSFKRNEHSTKHSNQRIRKTRH